MLNFHYLSTLIVREDGLALIKLFKKILIFSLFSPFCHIGVMSKGREGVYRVVRKCFIEHVFSFSATKFSIPNIDSSLRKYFHKL